MAAAAGAFDTAAASEDGETLDEAAAPPATDECAFLLLTAVAPADGGCSFHDLAVLLLRLLPSLLAGATPRESDRAGPPAVSPLPVAFVHTRLWPEPLRGCAADAPPRNTAAGVLGGGGRPTGFFVATLVVPAIWAAVVLLVHTRLRLPVLDFVLMTAWAALPLTRAGVVWRVARLGPLLGPAASALTHTRFPPALGAAPGTGEGEAAPGTWAPAQAAAVLFQDMLLPRPRPRDAGNMRPPLPAAAASPPRPLPPEYVGSTIFAFRQSDVLCNDTRGRKEEKFEKLVWGDKQLELMGRVLPRLALDGPRMVDSLLCSQQPEKTPPSSGAATPHKPCSRT